MVFLLLMDIVQPQDGGKEILPEIRLVFLSHRVLSLSQDIVSPLGMEALEYYMQYLMLLFIPIKWLGCHL